MIGQVDTIMYSIKIPVHRKLNDILRDVLNKCLYCECSHTSSYLLLQNLGAGFSYVTPHPHVNNIKNLTAVEVNE